MQHKFLLSCRFYLFTLFLFISIVYSQGQTLTDDALLAYIHKMEDETATDVKKLSKYLIQPTTNEWDRFRSIYLWLIHHIDYDLKAVKNKRINRSNEDILRRKKAICWGYATLLKALCEAADMEAAIISGYVKTDLEKAPFLKYPTHAWNAVQLEGQWYLVDATWDSGLLGTESTYYKKFQETYYLSEPAHFITNHLPATPQWQLLSCPVTIEHFQLSSDTIVQLAQKTDCAATNKTLPSYHSLTKQQQALTTAITSYQFNPTEDNRREFAHAQIEYQEYLSDIAERLQVEQKIDSLLLIQQQMIDLCETAQELTDLYDSQLENCAYNYFNHAVAFSRVPLTADNEQVVLATMLVNFQKAQQQLSNLKQNMFTENALNLCKEYMEYIELRIEK